MKLGLLLVCLVALVLGSASANDTSAAQNACQALLSGCQVQCATHDGINTGAANCIIENDGSTNLNCVCADGYQPPSSSAILPQAVFSALVAAVGAIAVFA